MDAKTLNEKLRERGSGEKTRIGLYIDKEVYKAFLKAIDGKLVSHAVELLMREVVDSTKGKGGRS
jgi:hypothetical protein